jgi:hypothetical protein
MDGALAALTKTVRPERGTVMDGSHGGHLDDPLRR